MPIVIEPTPSGERPIMCPLAVARNVQPFASASLINSCISLLNAARSLLCPITTHLSCIG